MHLSPGRSELNHLAPPSDGLAVSAASGTPTSSSSTVQFRLATPADDVTLRRLLRDNPLAGQISLSLEREPSYFAAAALEGADHRTIIAVEEGRVICGGSVSTRDRYVNGRPTRVGYLGGLRLDVAARGRASVLRRGYEFFRQLHERFGGPPLYLTAIAEDNLPARRLLERGLPGMPAYRPLGRLVTLVIRRRGNRDLVRRRLRRQDLELDGQEPRIPDLAALLDRNLRQYQFAPVWLAEDLRGSTNQPAAPTSDFRLIRSRGGEPVACAALWDQRAIKQTVVRGYVLALRRLRPFINLSAALLGRPRLPAVGQALSHAFVSHLATAADQPGHVEWLVRLLFGPAHSRGVDYLTLAFDDRDPRLPHLRSALRPREYASRLYAVHWPDGADAADGLDPTRLLAPEVALL
jgi:hypothetical protein